MVRGCGRVTRGLCGWASPRAGPWVGSLSPRVHLLSAPPAPPRGGGAPQTPASQPSVPRAALSLALHPRGQVPGLRGWKLPGGWSQLRGGEEGAEAPGALRCVCRRDCAQVLADTPHTLVPVRWTQPPGPRPHPWSCLHRYREHGAFGGGVWGGEQGIKCLPGASS